MIEMISEMFADGCASFKWTVVSLKVSTTWKYFQMILIKWHLNAVILEAVKKGFTWIVQRKSLQDKNEKWLLFPQKPTFDSLCNGCRWDLLQVLHAPLFQKLQDGWWLRAHRDVGHEGQILHQTHSVTLKEDERFFEWIKPSWTNVNQGWSLGWDDCYGPALFFTGAQIIFLAAFVPQAFRRDTPCPTACCVTAGVLPVFHLFRWESWHDGDGKEWTQRWGGSTPTRRNTRTVAFSDLQRQSLRLLC